MFILIFAYNLTYCIKKNYSKISEIEINNYGGKDEYIKKDIYYLKNSYDMISSIFCICSPSGSLYNNANAKQCAGKLADALAQVLL